MRVDADAGKGELGHVSAADQDGAGGPQTSNDRGVVLCRRQIVKRLGTGQRAFPRDVEQILDRHRQSGERRGDIAGSAQTVLGIGGGTRAVAVDLDEGARPLAGEIVAKTSTDQFVVNGIVGDGTVASFQVRGGVARGTEFLFEIHGEEGDLQLTATSRTSMQRQELNLKGARGAGTELADLPIPGKYRWVPDGMPSGFPYNVAQLYRQLAEGILDRKPVSPGFDAAVTRHRLIDLITHASETGKKQRAH